MVQHSSSFRNVVFDENYHQLLKKQVDDLAMSNDVKNARDLYLKINEGIAQVNKSNDGGLKQRYNILASILTLVALPLLKDEIALDFTEKELATAVDYFKEYNIDILRIYKRKIGNLLMIERDDFKKKLLEALTNNNQIITGDLEIHRQKVVGSVANWLKDFRLFAADRADEKLVKAEYLYKNQNIRRLASSDFVKVKVFFDLYERLKKSSYSLEGFDDSMLINNNGKLYGVFDGEIFDFSDKTVVNKKIEVVPNLVDNLKKSKFDLITRSQPLPTAENKVTNEVEIIPNGREEIVINEVNILQNKYNNFLVNNLMQGISAEWEKIKAESRGGMKELRTKFYHAVNSKDKAGAIGALLALAEAGMVRQSFGEDERFRKFWGNYLAKNNLTYTPLSPVPPFAKGGTGQLPSERGAGARDGQVQNRGAGARREDAVERFQNDPANAGDMALFIKYILEKRLEIAEKDAVMIGVIMGNLARKAGELEYQTMAYGEEERGEFRWNM